MHHDSASLPRLSIHHLVISLATGGAERLVVALAGLQKQHGHAVAVQCIQAAGPLAEELHRRDIPVMLHSARSAILACWRIWQTLRRSRPDVLHCHNVGATLPGALAARLARIPCIIATRHSGRLDSPNRERKFWITARWCHRVVAVSYAAQRVFAAAPGSRPDKLVVIPNGIAPPYAPVPPAPASPNAFTLVTAGRLVPEKDLSCLLEAFALALRSLPHLRLWILGDGPQRPLLEHLARRLGVADAVEFLGMRSDIGAWFAQADLFVLSSISEGLPIALLEALACGLPAVVTNVGGMPEVLNSSGAGFVVPARNPVALANAILEIARHPDRLPALREAARRRYRERFTLERVADDYFRLYQGCLHATGRSKIEP